MDAIGSLIQAITHPLGSLVLLGGVLLALHLRPQQSPWPWVIFALVGFAASLGEFRNEFITNPPPFAFPLQQLRQQGRPLTMALLALLLALGLRTRPGWRQIYFPRPLAPLIAIQVVLLLKVFLQGNLGFTLVATITFFAMIVALLLGPARWLQSEPDFKWAVRSIALVGIFFLLASLYQARIDAAPMMIVHGWFMGITGNPQQAAIFLMATIPCQFFLVMQPRQSNWQRSFWLILIWATFYTLIITGSRMGVLSTIGGVLIFITHRSERLKQSFLILGLGIAVLLIFTDITTLVSIAPDKLLQGTNTREGIWLSQWYSFLQHPLFGAPLVGDRLGFGENSWLAIAASTGIVGLIPAFIFAYECLTLILKLSKLGNIHPHYRLHCDTITFGLVILLIGSIAEAYLLGLLTFAVISLMTYLILGQFLLEVSESENPSYQSAPDNTHPINVIHINPGLRQSRRENP